MNIRVDLTTPIKDGTEVVFRSPVDCSKITGLIVYFTENGNTTSQEFALADAHGNNVGDIDHLFAENVVVKVILDVAHSMAFVQNADTNAYLEGRFDGIINTICPSFKTTGKVVQCEPVEGYPLNIKADSGNKLRFTVCGKNLYNERIYPLTKHLYVNKDKGTVHEASPDGQNQYAATAESMSKPYYIPVGHLAGKVITLNNTAGGNTPGMAFYNIDKVYISGGKGSAITVPDKAAYMLFTVNAAKVNTAGKMEIQVEIGSVATDYAPYDERSKESEKSCELVAFKGINTVFAYDGNNSVGVTVTGRSDPVAIIDKLTKAVISLGGNI